MSAILEHGLITIAIHLIQFLLRIRFLGYKIVRPNLEVRVAFSCLLRISDGGRYLLVRNLHRPDTFCPFGGVIKFEEDARKQLDKLLFRQQDFGPGRDMSNDLRGFLPRRYLGNLLSWFIKKIDREKSKQCLCRELREEIVEAGYVDKITVPKDCHFRHVWTIEEGPSKVPGMPYKQFRIFEVWDLKCDTKTLRKFKKRLFFLAKNSQNLLVSNSDEILTGRAAV